MWVRLQCCLTGVLFLGLLAGAATAGQVELTIKATNPADWEQTVAVRSELPPGLQPTDVTDSAGLDLDYAINAERFYLH